VLSVDHRVVRAVIESDTEEPVSAGDIPLRANPALKHDGPGILGLSGNDSFYLTLAESPELDGTYTALGRVIAGASRLGEIGEGDEIRSIRILRSGEAVREFATDDAAFQRLLEGGRGLW
jgi:hypothetical protein